MTQSLTIHHLALYHLLNNINLFYSFVFNQMQEVLTETKMKKLRRMLLSSIIGLSTDAYFDD